MFLRSSFSRIRATLLTRTETVIAGVPRSNWADGAKLWVTPLTLDERRDARLNSYAHPVDAAVRCDAHADLVVDARMYFGGRIYTVLGIDDSGVQRIVHLSAVVR